MLMHTKSLGSGRVHVEEDVHVPAFMAQHTALGVSLRKLCALAIKHVSMSPPNPVKRKKIKGLGNNKHRRVVREGCLPPL
jgi:hypothetical protein